MSKSIDARAVSLNCFQLESYRVVINTKKYFITKFLNFLSKQTAVDHNVLNGNLYVPYLFYVLTNIIPVAFGSILVAYVEVSIYFDFRFKNQCIKTCKKANSCRQRNTTGEMLSKRSKSA